MKKIINGKKYDTTTAQEIASKWGGEGFRHWDETLYKKRTGEFFLHGAGGPASRWAHACSDNSWSSGENIQPLTVGEAKEWMEANASCDEYEAVFGPVEE